MKHYERDRLHDDVIKWKQFPRYWPLVRGIYRSPVNFPHKGLWRRALMFSLICSWINDWVNNREAGDLRCHHVHYDVIVMCVPLSSLDYGVINPRMAVTKAPQISPLFIFLIIQTHMLDYQNHDYISQVSPKLSIGEFYQLWTWYSIRN